MAQPTIIKKSDLSQERLKIKEKLLERGVYYIVEVKPKKSRKKRGDIYLVLATSEKAAMNKVRRRIENDEECFSLGIYNQKENTLLIKNANKFVNFGALSKIED